MAALFNRLADRLASQPPWLAPLLVLAGLLALVVALGLLLFAARRRGRKGSQPIPEIRYDAEACDAFVCGEPLFSELASRRSTTSYSDEKPIARRGRLTTRKEVGRTALSPLAAAGIIDSYAAISAAVATCGGDNIDGSAAARRRQAATAAASLGASWHKQSLPARFGQVPQRAKSESVLQRMAALATSTGALSIAQDPLEQMNPAVAATQPQLDFGLQHDEHDEKLAVYVRGARNLRPDLDGRPTDCYLRVIVVRDLKKGWVRKRPSGMSVEDLTALSDELVPLSDPVKCPVKAFYRVGECPLDMVDMRTQTIRRALNPQFNEYFSVDLREKLRKYAVVKFALYNVDRKGRCILVGDTYHSLGRFDLTKLTDFTKPLKPYRPEIGEILITLAYLPTAERLSITIDASVKMTLLHRGKKMERQRTHVVRRHANPTIDSTHAFDLPHDELERASILIAVIHHESVDKDSGRGSSGSWGDEREQTPVKGRGRRTESVDPSFGRARSFSSCTEQDKEEPQRPEKCVTPQPTSCREDDLADEPLNNKYELTVPLDTSKKEPDRRLVLGRLLLGCVVAAGVGTERAHWLEVVRNPRQPIAHWHKLVP